MKTNCWLILGTMIATTAVAQVNTNKLPELPVVAPASTPAPEKLVAPPEKPAPLVHKKKPTAKTTAKPVVKNIVEAPVTLVAGPATVAAESLNLRGQAGLKGEVVGQVKKGDTVTVISQINLDKHKADEPAQWAKIALPSGTKVWVNSRFVDATNKVVTVKKLNLRGGPGENYSVLGVLEKGAAITEVTSKGDWTQIETPTNAFAFVAATYLKQEAAVVEPTNATPPVTVTPPVVEVAPATTNTVVEPPAVVTVPPTVETPVAPTPALPPVEPAVVTPAPVVPEVVETNPPPPRIVSHEGYVRSSISPVAPTYFELYDPTTGTAINYLYSTTTNLNLARYNSYQVVVTGEEGLDVRWKDTPVLTIQKIYVLSTNPPSVERVTSPRASQNSPRGSKSH